MLSGDDSSFVEPFPRFWDSHISITENALCFLDEAAKEFVAALKTPKRLKYSVLHLASSIELMAKAGILIYDGDWDGIVEKHANEKREDCETCGEMVPIEKQEKECNETAPRAEDWREKVARGERKTINFDKALKNLYKRVTNDNGGPTHDLSYQLIALLERRNTKAFRDWRNMLEHFKPPTDTAEYEPQLRTHVAFAIDLASPIVEYIYQNVPGASVAFIDKLSTIRKLIGDHSAFVKDRLKKIGPELKGCAKLGIVCVRCPTCGQPTLPIDGKYAKCMFCRAERSGDQAFVEFLQTYSDEHVTFEGFRSQADDRCAGRCPVCHRFEYYVNLAKISRESRYAKPVCFSCTFATKRPNP